MPQSSAITPRALLLLAFAIGAALIVALTITKGAGPPPANAADHLDAPDLSPPGGDPRLDINDVFAFPSTRDGYTTLIMTVNPATAAGEQGLFARKVPSIKKNAKARYAFRIDNDGDAKADVVIEARFGKANKKGTQRMLVTRNGRVLAAGRTSKFDQVRTVRGRMGTKAFGGTVEDPFFFDLNGFINLTAPLDDDPNNDGDSFLGCNAPRADFFAGLNVSAIVIEVKNSLLTGGGDSTIGVWATTNVGRKQIDRMGLPAINTVFIPNNPLEPSGTEASQKNAYNKSRPHKDQQRFRGEVVDTLETLFSLNDTGGPLGLTDDPSDDAGQISGLADFLLPDILPIDLDQPGAFPNGRALADDVIDTELGLITESTFDTDCVDANDVDFRKSFPYVAAPN